MLPLTTKVHLALLCLGGAASAQSAGRPAGTFYGGNDLAVNFDSEAVSRNFEDVDIQLVSPAFTSPDTIPSGFSNGTSGPTPDHEMGETLPCCLFHH